MTENLGNAFLFTQFLESVKNDLSREFSSLHTKKECEKYYNELCAVFYEKLPDNEPPRFDMMTDAHDAVVRALRETDSDFDKFYTKNRGFFDFSENYAEVLKCFREKIEQMPTLKQNDVRFLQYVFNNYKNYRSSEDYMGRIVRRRLIDISPELIKDINKIGDYESKEAERKETALLILRQFIKQFEDGTIEIDGEKAPIQGRNRGANENGGAGNYYSPAIEELCKEKYGSDFSKMAEFLSYSDMETLLGSRHCKFAEIADKLANAHFERQRKTKEFLYIFAIAFEMTFSKGDDDRIEASSDVNSCLFHDYYADNLVNHPRTANEEKAVDGYGINWKNFAECIFLYFIAKDKKEYSAKRKLYCALQLISSCKSSTVAKTAKDLRDSNGKFADAKTKLFKENFISVLLNMDENSFRKFLIGNYECGYDPNEGDANWIIPTQYANERRTATEIFYALSEAAEHDDLPLDGFNFAFALANKKGYIGYSFDLDCAEKSKNKIYVTEEFVDLINNFTDRFNMVGSNDTRFNHYDEEIIFRTDLLSMFSEKILVDFCRALRNKDEDSDEVVAVTKSFSDFYDFFCTKAKAVSIDGIEYCGANSILFASNYQEISSKNIFDIILIYLTYRKFYKAANIDYKE